MTLTQPPAEVHDMHARILDAATCLFVMRGYRGISMREIAAAVGISKAGLYYYFKDKEALFLAILAANLDIVEQIIHDASRAGVTTRGRVTHMIRAILALPPNQRAIIRLAGQEMVHVSQAARMDFGVLYQQKFLSQVAELLQMGITTAEVRPINLQLATWLLLGMTYPFFDPSHPLGDLEETIGLLVSVFFDGVSRREDETDILPAAMSPVNS